MVGTSTTRSIFESLENRRLFAAGALDKSFAGGAVGYDPGNSSDGARPVAVLADGTVCVAGQRTDGLIEVVRFNNKGKRIGATALDLIPSSTYENLGMMQSDSHGDLLIAGTFASKNKNFIFVARLKPDLSLDKTFGTGGINSSFGKTPIDTDITVTQMREAPDGSIFVCGYKSGSIEAAETQSGLVAKLTPKGQPDTTFNTTGFEDLGTTTVSRVVDLDIRADGRIVLGGADQLNIDFGGISNMALMQLMPNGATDTTGFGTKGVIHYNPFNTASSINGVRILKNGRIVVAGQANAGAQGDQFTVMKFTIGGGFDKTFGHKGRFYFAESDNENAAGDLKIQADGKIVVSGVLSRKIKKGYDEDAAVLRLTTAGKLDTTFNGGNPLLIDLGSHSDIADFVVLDNAGRIVLGGASVTASFSDTLYAMRVLTA